MREIKFRGKRQDNGEWVYGDLLQGLDYIKIREQNVNKVAQSFVVIPETVGQYTGLKDKNGKEIYEGHIVEEDGMLSVCKFLNSIGSYAFIPIEMYKEDEEKLNLCSTFREVYELFEEHGTDCFFENDVPWKYVTVIGNIYENPELLEVKE